MRRAVEIMATRTERRPLERVDWGLTDYREAMERQDALVTKRQAGECGDLLVFTQHRPVFTIGRRIGAERHLIWKPEELEQKGVVVERTERGGDITFHGPGQIVCYPIISLAVTRDLHAYLRSLEEVLIRSLQEMDLDAGRREGKTGIWIENRKIAAIGVAVRRWVTLHGFALNVNNDLAPFTGIIPCGIPANEGQVTSVALEKGEETDIEDLKNRLTVEFHREFGNTMGYGEYA